MTFKNGRYEADDVQAIEDVMISDAKEYFGTNLNDTQESVIRMFYRPIAVKFQELQEDIGTVLDASQIDHAEGQALDFLTALIGIVRKEATTAKGFVTFSRSEISDTDYTIPKGTKVQTDGISSRRYKTVESAVLSSGTVEKQVPVESLETGSDYNVGPRTVNIMVDPPSGIENVTNYSEINGASEIENDSDLRKRAKEELSQGSRSTSGAIYKAVNSLEGTESVKVFPNNPTRNLGNDPGFELVVKGGNETKIGQAIVETKAAGDHTYGGNYGTKVTVNPVIANGQIQEERFTRPANITIFVEATITTDENYAGDNEVIDSIVNYIGGINTGGNSISGEVNVGNNVLFGEVEYAIRNIKGVFDVTNLQISTTSPASGTSNITIAESEVATTNAINGDITININ